MAKQSPLEKIYKHAANLKKKCDTICTGDIKDRMNDYVSSLTEEDYQVGHWTLLKHISLAYCINPFGVILNKRYKAIDRVYLDAYSGSGISPLKEENGSPIKWTIGSPLIASTMTDFPFSYYLFNDKDEKSLELLDSVLKDLSISNFEIHNMDANNFIINSIPKIKDKYVFAFLDPTGFNINWESLCSIFQCNMFDIFLNFQTRSVDRYISSATEEHKKLFFGESYEAVKNATNCDDVLDCYISAIEKHGMHVEKIRIRVNRTQQYYYHILHISRERLDYHGIVRDLKEIIESQNGASMKRIWDDVTGNQRQSSLRLEFD